MVGMDPDKTAAMTVLEEATRAVRAGMYGAGREDRLVDAINELRVGVRVMRESYDVLKSENAALNLEVEALKAQCRVLDDAPDSEHVAALKGRIAYLEECLISADVKGVDGVPS